MAFVDTSRLRTREPRPGWKGRFFHSRNMTFGYYDIDADAEALHEHRHPQEEVWHVIDGELVFTIDGNEYTAGPGCAAVVPSDSPHSARPTCASRAIVVDYPLRTEVGGVPTSDDASG
jgi:quercetin dioxygenase-like cupin family protein